MTALTGLKSVKNDSKTFTVTAEWTKNWVHKKKSSKKTNLVKAFVFSIYIRQLNISSFPDFGPFHPFSCSYLLQQSFLCLKYSLFLVLCIFSPKSFFFVLFLNLGFLLLSLCPQKKNNTYFVTVAGTNVTHRYPHQLINVNKRGMVFVHPKHISEWEKQQKDSFRARICD